jgi:hypothetical protein
VPSPRRSTGSTSPAIGLPSEESGRRLEDLALLLKPAVLAPQPAQLLALVAAQPVAALTAIQLALPARLRNDCGETPSSSAICGIDRSLERTSSTAWRRNSGAYAGRVRGMDTSFLPGPKGPSAQVSTKPGQLQAAVHG